MSILASAMHVFSFGLIQNEDRLLESGYRGLEGARDALNAKKPLLSACASV